MREVARRRSDGSIPGLAIAVTDRDGLLVDRVYGEAEVASGRPVTTDTLFEIGSIGKTFTAIVILQLAEEGRLGLDDPVVRHLPWFRVPRTGARITIRHLLSQHRAGSRPASTGTPEATFQVWRLRDLWPGCGPGRRYHYSNVGYKTLGLVIEALEGESYPAVLRRRILEPLGMTATAPDDHQRHPTTAGRGLRAGPRRPGLVRGRNRCSPRHGWRRAPPTDRSPPPARTWRPSPGC